MVSRSKSHGPGAALLGFLSPRARAPRLFSCRVDSIFMYKGRKNRRAVESPLTGRRRFRARPLRAASPRSWTVAVHGEQCSALRNARGASQEV
ncbi:hypothetical protein D187_006391 [Cystobacter fuscus DSM 2262]|uniref:Uncharacterized protein n=1 Tax=Cystobacter fuscus (strain ATCC 25194 / DSM 2262 / NBRC 100088 / M29) TaxID=1242864 RepID=S9PIS5_CYSF2|nr:hypothetical protein D187_006391 [Cystobacter fuscus DSM 2262]